MINFDLVRAYYFDPPPPDPHRVPSDEELIARDERRRYERCIRRSGDLPSPASRASEPGGGISLYEMARALHITGNWRNALVRWINGFAIRPETGV